MDRIPERTRSCAAPAGGARRRPLRVLPLAALAGLVATGPAAAELPAVTLRVIEPPARSLDATTLGKATHPIRILVANPTARPVALPPLSFRFTASREGVSYPCDPTLEAKRAPRALEPGESTSVERAATCLTPLPGRYDVEVRVRPRGAPESEERALPSFSLTIEPGTRPSVRLPWRPNLWATADVSRDLRPGQGASAGARAVIGLVNATPRPARLAPERGLVRVKRRATGALVCPEQVFTLPFDGELASGRLVSAPIPLPCDFSREGVYDVEIALLGPSGPLPLGTHPIRVAALPTPIPPPAGGMMGGH